MPVCGEDLTARVFPVATVSYIALLQRASESPIRQQQLEHASTDYGERPSPHKARDSSLSGAAAPFYAPHRLAISPQKNQPHRQSSDPVDF